MSAFPFDVPFQRSIARLTMLDEGFASHAFKYIAPEFFTTKPLGWIWTTLSAYWQKYATPCTEVVLRDALRAAPPEYVTAYSAEIDAVCAMPHVPDSEYIREQVQDFCRRSTFAGAHKRASDLYNEGKPIEAYDESQRALDRIRDITFQDDNRSFFFEEAEKRVRSRIVKAATSSTRTFGTVIGPLNTVCNGGIEAGEMWMVQGEAKAGKTTWLINNGFVALRGFHAPVLHIQLEGKREQTEARYDARFSGEFYREVRNGIFGPGKYRDMMDEYRQLSGLLVIRAFSEWDTTALDIEGELKTLKARGFVPKMLILDYVDLLRSRNKRVDSETQHQIEATRDLKRLTMNWNLATHTVAQTQRPKDDFSAEHETIIRASKLADAYGKARIVDFVGSLNVTRKERELGVSRFFAEMHRDNPVGKLYRLTNDLAKMIMGAEVEEIEVKEDERRSRKKKEDAGGSPP